MGSECLAENRGSNEVPRGRQKGGREKPGEPKVKKRGADGR